MSLITTLRDLIEVELPKTLALPEYVWHLGSPRVELSTEEYACRYERFKVDIISTQVIRRYGEGEPVGLSISHFELTELPGNAEILVSHDVSVGIHFRCFGLGLALCRFRIAMAKQVGYKAILCTVARTNLREGQLLAEAGFVHIYNSATPTASYWHRSL